MKGSAIAALVQYIIGVSIKLFIKIVSLRTSRKEEIVGRRQEPKLIT
jgi:hypothetical protein